MPAETYKPREYQALIVEHILRNKRAAVWASMGMGKTVATLTAVDIADTIELCYPVLIVGPKRVAKSVWPREVKKWKHLNRLRVSTLVGELESREEALRTPAHIYTVNSENLEWLCGLFSPAKWPFRTIIFDESRRLHGFRQRGGTRQALALRKHAFRRVVRMIELTGTPAPNGLKDLWGQLYFIDKGARLGLTWADFVGRWFTRMGAARKLVPEPFAQRQISELCADVAISIRAEDWLPVDRIEPIPVYVDLPAKVMRAYKELERTAVAKLNDGTEITAANAAVITGKCLQLATGGVLDEFGGYHHEHDEKYEALDSIINEAGGEPIMVAYYNRHERDIIMQRYEGARYLDDDPATEDAWNRGEIPVLVFHPKSAGHGLNLQLGGRRMAFLHQDWDLELYLQAIERIGPTRQYQAGLDRAVLVYIVMARKTFDVAVFRQRKVKSDVQDLLTEYVAAR